MLINEFAARYFNGNEEIAMYAVCTICLEQKWILLNNKAEADEMVDAMTPEQNKIYEKALQAALYREDLVVPIIKKTTRVAILGLTEDEVLQVKKNPFAKKILLFSALFVGFIAALIILASIQRNDTANDLVNILLALFSLFSPLIVGELGISIVKYFRFNKIKRELKENNAAKPAQPAIVTEADRFAQAAEITEKYWEYQRFYAQKTSARSRRKK